MNMKQKKFAPFQSTDKKIETMRVLIYFHYYWTNYIDVFYYLFIIIDTLDAGQDYDSF